MELPTGTDSNSTSKVQSSGKSGTRTSIDGSNPTSTKKTGSGFFGSKSRRIKLHSSKEWQEKTRIILQRYYFDMHQYFDMARIFISLIRI